MRFSSVRDKAIGLLVIIASLSTLGHAFKAIQPGSDNTDDDRPWYITTPADWGANFQNRTGKKLKAYEQRHMNVIEARALCRKHGAKLALIDMMHVDKYHALFPFDAWVEGDREGECRVAKGKDGFSYSRHECCARLDFAICERPAD
ncbi:hypothetical protein Q1695_014342 [Nippostrongylus brasiliensis]|nr:hypothetical protein Q1695_014342 [Nippostrongylus brasiliensis]